MVDLMLSLGTDDYNETMAAGAHGGHMHVVKSMLSLCPQAALGPGAKTSQAATNYDRAISYTS